MIIYKDSKEQNGMEFSHEALEGVEVRALPFGDYWARYKDGSTSRFIVERKALGDFFGSFGGNYEAEKKKLVKFSKNEIGIVKYIVVVEAPITEMLQGYEYSTKKGRDLFRTMMTWRVKYGVETVFAKRSELEFFIAELFYSDGMEQHRLKKVEKG